MPEVKVENVLELAEGQSRVFSVPWQGQSREAFVLRHQGELRVYLNECPHWSVELDLGDGHFYDPALDRIYCKNHGALFRADDGVCETGPCFGRALVSLDSRREGSDLWVLVP